MSRNTDFLALPLVPRRLWGGQSCPQPPFRRLGRVLGLNKSWLSRNCSFYWSVCSTIVGRTPPFASDPLVARTERVSDSFGACTRGALTRLKAVPRGRPSQDWLPHNLCKMRCFHLRRLLLTLAAVALTSCGYHIAGKTNLMPQTIQTIAIPAFSNGTTVYKLTDQLSEAVTREFISRTKYHITADPSTADATLRGYVTQIFNFPTVYDPVTFRAANVEVHVNLKIQLVDKSGKVLFDRPGMEVRERYEVSIDPKVYFDESENAMRRLSRDVAKTVVSAILENF